MAMSNTKEGVTINIVRDMNIFDALPENVRKILSEQPFDFHVEPIARLFVEMKKRGLSKQYIEYEIRQTCRRNS